MNSYVVPRPLFSFKDNVEGTEHLLKNASRDGIRFLFVVLAWTGETQTERAYDLFDVSYGVKALAI